MSVPVTTKRREPSLASSRAARDALPHRRAIRDWGNRGRFRHRRTVTAQYTREKEKNFRHYPRAFRFHGETCQGA